LSSLTNNSAAIPSNGTKTNVHQPSFLVVGPGTAGPFLGNLLLDGFRFVAAKDPRIQTAARAALRRLETRRDG
jgi:hypothetical protein